VGVNYVKWIKLKLKILNFACFVFPSLDFPHYDFSVVLVVYVAT